MGSGRKRGRPCINGGDSSADEGTKVVSGTGYENFRNQRVKENMERMHKLGIFELSLKLNSAPKRVSQNPSHKKIPSKPSGHEPPRRSSRLESLAPISYSEIRPKSKEGTSRSNEIYIKEGSQPEIYTEEHAKLLGDCKSSWALMVDGYNEDGNRLLDPINGKSCHQCRQKALGQHTHCSKCNSGQGQLCGDCLYTRYGENVMEVIVNSKWICPVCRDICNCSRCRKLKGWAPTGALHRKVCNLGFKSVAHYLIQTCQAKTNLEGSSTENLVAVDKQEALSNTGLKVHLLLDDSLSSVDGSDFEDEVGSNSLQ